MHKNLNTSLKTIGFFHPYCDTCGGGEKVLFQAIEALQNSLEFHDHQVIVYSGSEQTKTQILTKIKDRFGIKVKEQNLTFFKLEKVAAMAP